MKELSPSPPQRVILLEPEDGRSNPRHVEMAGDAPNLRDYWQVIRKHKWRIIACFLTAIFVTGVIIFSMTPIYTASATLLIERKGPQVVDIKQVLSESVESDEHSYYESQYAMLKSRSLAAEVIKDQKLDSNPQFTGQARRRNLIAELWGMPMSWLDRLLSPAAPVPAHSTNTNGISSELINVYTGMLDIKPLQRSRLVAIAISAPDPVLAAQIANAHANAYVHQGFELRAGANQEARKFLEGKLAELKNRVEKSEDALNSFRRSKGIISLDDKENIIVDRLADLNKRLTEAEAERITAEAQARLIKNREYDSLPAVIGNSLISTLKSQVVQLEAEHAKLSAQFLPGYPRLAQVKAQLDEAKQRLAQQIKNVVDGINSAYYAAMGKEKEIRAQMEKQKSDTFALKDAAVQYAILARETNTNKQLYDSVLERFKEISVAGEIPSSNITILDRAEIPIKPSKPQKRLDLMLGALLGLMGGLGLALLLEHLNDTLRTPEEVEHYLRLPNLAIVPDFYSLPNQRNGWKSLVHYNRVKFDNKLCLPTKQLSLSERRLSVVTESYRKLRAAILLSRPDTPPKTILFTSGTSSEGKTITVANTAIMFAWLGNRVLLMDADLRRPTCHKALKVQGAPGLVDYLAGQEKLDKAIKLTSVPNLWILNGGSVPPSPTELIGSKKMQDTLALLKESYDFIFIDSPPIMPVSDAVVLSTLTDGIIFVVRGQNTPKHIVKEAISQLGNNRSKILGVVLNRVDVRSAEYRDYFQYYNPEYYYPSTRLT
jgi:polysaccharide biosynthesis transport protein